MGSILLFLHRLLGVAAPVIKALAPWALAATVGAMAFHFAPVVGSRAQLARAEAVSDSWEKAAGDYLRSSNGWESSFRSAEAMRKRESATARAAVASQIQQCSTRVAEARASARVIERIVTKEPTYDQDHCPVRDRVDPGLLRDALIPGSRAD